MSELKIETKVLIADLLNTNRKIVDEWIAEAMKRRPGLPEAGDPTAVAMAAKKREGFEEAIQEIFGDIPGDRTRSTASSFIDMST